MGELTAPAAPFTRRTASAPAPERAAPLLGEHTREIAASLLGLGERRSTSSSGERCSGERGLEVTREDGVGLDPLNRPDKRNAISLGCARALADALAGARRRRGGPRRRRSPAPGPPFCAGVDLNEARRGQHARREAASSHALDALREAAARGDQRPGGRRRPRAGARGRPPHREHRHATFALPEVKLGSLPGSGGTQRLARRASPALAAKLLFTGEPIDAAEALRAASSPTSSSRRAAAARGRALAGAHRRERAALAARRQARALRASAASAAGLELERALWGLLALTDDRAEGRAAFREKRVRRSSRGASDAGARQRSPASARRRRASCPTKRRSRSRRPR